MICMVIFMLEINNLTVCVDKKEILKDLNLSMGENEIHVLMGPNGAGKSTVCKSIMHHLAYHITQGNIIYNQKDITKCNTADIAKLGMYYISQTPIEIEGITNLEMLRTALLNQDKKVDIFEFNKKCNLICDKLHMSKSFLQRHVNEGMSGGERKKNELFGMWILEPNFILLDEIDSGLDVDALKLVGETLKEYQKEYHASILMITHQEKLIDQLKPNYVHIMKKGTIVESGSMELAKKIEKIGFNEFFKEKENE